jgi:uncharacterized protein (TIGR02246 family)
MNKRVRAIGAFVVVGLCYLVVISQVIAADDAAKAVRDADMAWSKAASSGDLNAVVSFYADDATMLSPNAPMAKGKDAVRKEWDGVMKGFGKTLHWQPTKVEAAKSGELAYSIGTYEGTFTPPNGKPVKDKGKYVEVWKKQADGKWKCIVDSYSSDLAQ